MADIEVAERLLSTWASDAAALAHVLRTQDPSWGSEAREIAGGWLVLWGPGLYVNRAIAAGFKVALTPADLDVIVERSAIVGVTPAVEACVSTHPRTRDLLVQRCFKHDPTRDVTVLVRQPDARRVPAREELGVVVRSVSAESLHEWQNVSAQGWGHISDTARRAADAFSSAAFAVEGTGMLIAFDASDDRSLGCASLTVRGSVATMGAMSTVPQERGRGVHAALIHHRLAVAHDLGCDLVAATAAAGGPSERNLVRHGFSRQFTIETWTLSPAVPAA